MRRLPILLAAGLGLVLAAPAGAQSGASLRIGVGAGTTFDDATEADRPPAGAPGRAATVAPRAHRASGSETGGKRHHPPPEPGFVARRLPPETHRDRDHRSDRRRPHPFLLVPDRDDDDDERIILVPVPVPPADAAAETKPPAEAAPPPDPRGPDIRRARGAGTASPVSIGAPLPGDMPHVTLDWRRYGLPEPPPGLVYARVGREVLLIDPATRVVERRVDPAALAAPQGEQAG